MGKKNVDFVHQHSQKRSINYIPDYISVTYH